MRKVGNFASGRVKVVDPQNVSADRYDYLKLEEAEPNLGVANTDDSILFTGQTGLREWIALSPDLEINANNELGIAAGITQTIEDIALANTNFQDVTDVGATTTNRIGVSGIDVTNDITAADLYLAQNGTITFEGSSNNTFETILTVTNPTADRTITIPDVTGTVITTGNPSDLGASLGNLLVAGDIPFTTQYDYIVQSGATSYKLDPTYAVAGKVVIAEAVDAVQNAAYNLVMAQTDNGSIATGSTTTSRDLMVDSGGITFNPATNQFQTQIVVAAQAVASPIITSVSNDPTVTIQGSGAAGVVRINDSLHVHDQVVHVNDNIALWNTNSDLGIVGHYATAANTAASDIVAGTEYQIISLGSTTPWTEIGATTAEVGETFTATANGSGDGIAIETSAQNAAFFGIDRSDNLTFKYYSSGSYTDSTSYNDKVWTGTLGSAEFGGLTVASQTFPAAVGANNQVLGVVNSATGQLGYFSAALTDTNNTYVLDATANSTVGVLTLTEDGTSTDDVIFTGAGSTSISSNSTHIIVNSSDTNDFLTGLSFDTANGVLTATVQNQSDVTVDLDGRYQLAGSYLTAESDTLQTVTDRGASSNNAITITDTTASSNTSTGALIVSGGVGVAGGIFAGGASEISYDYPLSYPSGISNVLTLKNTNATANSVAFGLTTSAGGTGSVSKSVTFVNADGKFVLQTSSASNGSTARPFELTNTQLILSPTTASSNTTTGALTVAGGVGIGERLNVEGNVNFIGANNVPKVVSISPNTGGGYFGDSSNQSVILNLGNPEGGAVPLTSRVYFGVWAGGATGGYIGGENTGADTSGLKIYAGNSNLWFGNQDTGFLSKMDRDTGDWYFGGQKISVGDTANTGATSIIEGSGTIWIDPSPVSGDANGVVIIKGDLQVDGTTTTLNSTTLTIDDLNIVVASGAADSAAADGAGLTVDGANKSITWNHTGQYFTADTYIEADGFKVGTQTGFLKADGTVDTNTYLTTDTNTTYDLLAIEDANSGTIRLSDSANANDDITFVGSGATTVTSNATHVIISSVDNNDNDNTTYDLLSVANTAANAGILRLDPDVGANDDVIFTGTGGTTVSSNATHIIIDSTDNNDNTTYTIQVDVNATAGATDLALVDSGAVKDLVTFAGAGNIQVNRTDANTFQITDDTTPTYTGPDARLSITNNANTTSTPAINTSPVTGLENVALDVQGTSYGSVARFRRNTKDIANFGGVIRVEMGEDTGPEGDPWVTFLNYGTTGGTLKRQGEIATTYGNSEGSNGIRLWGQDAIDFDVNDGDETGEDGNTPDNLTYRVASIREQGIVIRNGKSIYYHANTVPKDSSSTNITITDPTALVTELAFTDPTARRTITFPDASGTVALTSDIPTDTNTTYDLSVPASTTAIRLAGSDSTNDDVTITGGTNVTVTRTSATELTISSSYVDTNTTYDLVPVSNTTNGVVRLSDSANANDDVAIFGSGATSVTSNSSGIYISSTDNNDNDNTTYDLASVANTAANEGIIRLTDSASANDDVKIVGAGATIVSSNSTQITITSTDTNTDTNDYLDGLSFNTGTGVLTASVGAQADVTVDLDGRYLTSYTETDTLDSVTTRGNVTDNSITVGSTVNVSASGAGNVYVRHNGMVSAANNAPNTTQPAGGFHLIAYNASGLTKTPASLLTRMTGVTNNQETGDFVIRTLNKSGSFERGAFLGSNRYVFAPGHTADNIDVSSKDVAFATANLSLDQGVNAPNSTLGADEVPLGIKDSLSTDSGYVQMPGGPRTLLDYIQSFGYNQNTSQTSDLAWTNGHQILPFTTWNNDNGYFDATLEVFRGDGQGAGDVNDWVIFHWAGPTGDFDGQAANGSWFAGENTSSGGAGGSNRTDGYIWGLHNGAWHLLFRIPLGPNASGYSKEFPGWYQAGSTVTTGDGKRKAYDELEITHIAFSVGTTSIDEASIGTHQGLLLKGPHVNVDADTIWLGDASSQVVLNRLLTLPSTDGTSGQALVTDGSGNLSFQTFSSTDNDTTYTLTAAQTGGTDTNPAISLNAGGSGSGSDTITLVGSGATTITRNNDGQITISSTDTDTNTDTLQSISADSTNATRYISFVNSTSGAQTAGVDTALTFNPSTNALDLNGTMTIDCGDTATGLSVRGNSGAGNSGRLNIGYGNGTNNPKIQWDDVNNDMFWGMGAHDSPNNMYLWGNAAASLPSFSSHTGGVTPNIQFEFTTNGDLNIYGTLSAASKSFVIDHPTKEGMKLRHGSLEGPENGVYVRGRLKDDNTIELPDYWVGLVDEDTITVNLTPIGKHQKLYVEDIGDNKVIVGNDNLMNKAINCFYTVFAERKDVDKLTVEYEA